MITCSVADLNFALFNHLFRDAPEGLPSWLKIESLDLNIIFHFCFHIHDCVEDIVEYIFLNMHDIQIMSNDMYGPSNEVTPKRCFASF